MKIRILGAGPAGLWLARSLKRHDPSHDIAIVEQNPADATFGFGLAFSERALDFLKREDAETWAAMQPGLEFWSDSILYLNGTEIRIDGMGYAGIGRLRARQDFQQRRFAGALLAEQRMDLAGGDLQMHAFQRLDAGKLLGDSCHLQDRRGRSLICGH